MLSLNMPNTFATCAIIFIMAMSTGTAQVVTTNRIYNGKIRCARLLHPSYSADCKAENKKLGNLAQLPEPMIDSIRRSLQGGAFVSAGQAVALAQVAPAMHSEAAMRKVRWHTLNAGPSVHHCQRLMALLHGMVRNTCPALDGTAIGPTLQVHTIPNEPRKRLPDPINQLKLWSGRRAQYFQGFTGQACLFWGRNSRLAHCVQMGSSR